MEGKLIDFYRCLRTIDKQSTAFVAANLGIDCRGTSDRWLSELNKKDRSENMFKCEVINTCNNIKTMIESIMTESKETITFSIAIDGTKVPKSLNINTAHECIMGCVYPNHPTCTTHLNKEEINKILNNKEEKELKQIDLASEVKVATTCFQNQPKRTSPGAVMSAHPQGVNETSNFTDDVCRAASKIVNDYKKSVFTNFAIDRVSVRNTRHYEKKC